MTALKTSEVSMFSKIIGVGVMLHYLMAILGGPPEAGTHNAGWFHWVVIHVGAIGMVLADRYGLTRSSAAAQEPVDAL